MVLRILAIDHIKILLLSGWLLTSGCKYDQKIMDKVSEKGISNGNPAALGNPDSIFFKKENDAFILPWKYLMSVKFEEKYSEKMGMEVSLPLFSDTLKMLDGQLVQVEGFYIPVDETGNDKIVILSAYPFSQCFFCGKAGVESIIDILSPKKLPVLKIDTKLKFKGRLKLNRDNFDYLIYVLEEAELVK